jgi:predicted acylesterase/phospholipase RssA
MQYDLVFEGGSAKGMPFVGALQAFTEAGFGLGPDPDTERAEAAADKLAQRLLG